MPARHRAPSGRVVLIDVKSFSLQKISERSKLHLAARIEAKSPHRNQEHAQADSFDISYTLKENRLLIARQAAP
jgi:hypothetical protein